MRTAGSQCDCGLKYLISAAAFGAEELHIVAEVSPESWCVPAELADDVRRKIRDEIGLSPSTLTIVAPGTLERTSSGKVKRRARADAHRHGPLKIVRSGDRLLYRTGRARRRVFASIRGMLPRRIQRDGRPVR